MSNSSPLIVFIQGPTATGKTDFALRLVERFGGEIIGCDSIQVYQEINIGTAKPSRDEMKKAVHHMIDVVPVGETYTAADYRRAVFAILENVKNQNKIFYVTGGTGFYFLALEKGMYDVPEVPVEVMDELRMQILNGKHLDLYRELESLDPVYAQTISANDSYRLQRALGLIRTLGISMSEIKKKFSDNLMPFPYPLLKIGLSVSREQLRSRVRVRTEKMLKSGLIQEVQRFRERGFGNWSPLLSVGYKETQQYLDGLFDNSALHEQIVTHTMQLAKRQMTWFKKDLDLNWFDSESGTEQAERVIEEYIMQWRKS